jgi:hypothetical protein
MPGITSIRKYFQGGGADLGAGATGMGSGSVAPGPGDTGGAGGFDRNTDQFNNGGANTASGLENNRLKNIQTMDRFTKFRPEVNIPNFGLTGILGNLLKGGIQNFSDFTTGRNRDFFRDVIGAGKIEGLNYGTVSDMSDQQLEEAYQNYMSGRLSGETDAYGNPLNQGNDNPLQNIIQAQEAGENPQGGVAQYYNQYLQQLGML